MPDLLAIHIQIQAVCVCITAVKKFSAEVTVQLLHLLLCLIIDLHKTTQTSDSSGELKRIVITS